MIDFVENDIVVWVYLEKSGKGPAQEKGAAILKNAVFVGSEWKWVGHDQVFMPARCVKQSATKKASVTLFTQTKGALAL
jgi:hypothetical protein